MIFEMIRPYTQWHISGMYNCIYCSILLYMYTIVILYVRVYNSVCVGSLVGGLVSLSACLYHIWLFCRKKLIKIILLLVNHDIHTSSLYIFCIVEFSGLRDCRGSVFCISHLNMLYCIFTKIYFWFFSL